jgi:hypothetical protein
VNIELKLIATMLYTGDFSPIIKGDITDEHFETDSGKVLYAFIRGYGKSTNGAARWPSLSIVRKRFKNSAIELPDPEPGERVDALAHETILEHFRSKLRAASVELETVATSSSDPYGDILPVVSKLRKATEVVQRSHHASLATGILDVLDNYHTGTILPNGIPWPWDSLNKATKGLHRKEFIVFAGRPKSRKTFTTMRVGVNAVRKHHARVLMFTPEMPVHQVLLRTVAHFCDLRYTEFKDGSMAEAEEMRLLEAAEAYGLFDGESEDDQLCRLQCKFTDLPIGARPSFDIVQSTGRDISWMESQIEFYQPDIVICDSFYRQRADGAKRNDTDWKVVSALSREMKDMFMNMNVAGLGTHQLNRGAEKSVGDLSNLGLADAIGQDADGIYRVVTGKINGEDVSALLNLGGREVPFEGIMINNRPCYDYDERGVIVSKKQVEQLMQQEEEEAAKESDEEIKQSSKGNGKKGPGTPAQFRRPLTPSRFVNSMGEQADEDLAEEAAAE